MRTLTYLVATSLDGFIAADSRDNPSQDGGLFAPYDGILPFVLEHYPDIFPTHMRAAFGLGAEPRRFDTVVEGRRSYEIGLAAGIPNAYVHLRHLVFSRTMTTSPDPGVELVATDPVERIRELKAEAGKGIWLVGGAGLARSLYDEIDELVLKVNPVTACAGIPVFGGAASVARWTLTSSVTPDGEVVVSTYTRDR